MNFLLSFCILMKGPKHKCGSLKLLHNICFLTCCVFITVCEIYQCENSFCGGEIASVSKHYGWFGAFMMARFAYFSKTLSVLPSNTISQTKSAALAKSVEYTAKINKPLAENEYETLTSTQWQFSGKSSQCYKSKKKSQWEIRTNKDPPNWISIRS